MQYLLMIYSADGFGPAPNSPEMGKLVAGYGALTAEMRENGILVDGNPLQGVDTATTIKVRDGKTDMRDGPFAETKEQLGGYYLLECKDLDEAARYAEKIPTAAYGSIEIRPIMAMS
jgi:hypothetical protein